MTLSPTASDALVVDIHLRPGNSGSPVYRPDGGVIGVVDKRDPLRPSYSVAVAIHYAIELAERSGVTMARRRLMPGCLRHAPISPAFCGSPSSSRDRHIDAAGT